MVLKKKIRSTLSYLRGASYQTAFATAALVADKITTFEGIKYIESFGYSLSKAETREMDPVTHAFIQHLGLIDGLAAGVPFSLGMIYGLGVFLDKGLKNDKFNLLNRSKYLKLAMTFMGGVETAIAAHNYAELQGIYTPLDPYFLPLIGTIEACVSVPFLYRHFKNRGKQTQIINDNKKIKKKMGADKLLSKREKDSILELLLSETKDFYNDRDSLLVRDS